MDKRIGTVIVGATLVVAHCLIGGTAFAATQENGQPCPPECVTDSLEIITYYPSPYGYYEELRGDKIIVGDTDNSHIDETHLPPSGTLTFEPKSYAQITTEGTLYEGTVYYDSFDHEFKYYDNNNSWQPLGGGGEYWDILTGNDIYNTNTGNIKLSGNVGIGVGAGDTIGAKLQINTSADTKGLVVKSAFEAAYSVNFLYTGGPQTYVVPPGVTSLTIEAYGAQGGGPGGYGVGGLGGKAKATVTVTSGEVIYVYVGGAGNNDQAGYNGGGAGGPAGGGGGGASDVRRGGTALTNRIIVAGGGGGGGYWSVNSKGGVGGGTSGGGGAYVSSGGGGGGGTQTDGGAGAGSAGDGYYGSGGDGAYASGGGGGGYLGGGGGAGNDGGASGGGGGGSSYVTGTNTSTQSGVNSGNGKVIIISVGAGNMTEWKDATDRILAMIDIEGKVGIGTASPSAYLDIAAGKTTIADAWSARSSLRFKENLYPIDNALTKLTSLQGVYFDHKDNHKHSLGLVAEDVGKVFPELVTYEANGQDAISLDYDKLGAVTIEAIKEQQKEIEELKALLKETARSQQKEIELLKAENKQKAIYP